MREELALLVPNALFHGEPAHALHVAAFNLAFVDGRVDTFAGIMNDVHGLDPILARACVNFNFTDRCAIAVVIKGMAREG